MNKLFILSAVVFAAIAFSSCKNEKKPSDMRQVLEFRSTLTKQDTTQVLDLANKCMELLKNKNIDQAVASLNEYDDSLGQVMPLSKESEKGVRKMFQLFPVLDYELSYYSLQSEGINDVKYTVTFAEEQNPEKNGRPVTSYMFNPVKVDGVWYLCVKKAGQTSDQLRK